MSERCVVAVEFIYHPETRTAVREVLKKFMVRYWGDMEDGQEEDTGPIYGWCKPTSASGIEIMEFEGYGPETLLTELAEKTILGPRWWMAFIGDAGDQAALYRFHEGKYVAIEVHAADEYGPFRIISRNVVPDLQVIPED